MGVTEASADCIANVIQDSPLGTFKLNQVNLNEFFHHEPGFLPFDTTSLARFLPIFEEKLGPNVPLEINLSYRDMKFTFGADWSDNNEGEIDIDVEYILRMRVYNQTHDPLDI